MQRRNLVALTMTLLSAGALVWAATSIDGSFVGQDMHLAGESLLSYQLSSGEHALVFQGGCSLIVGANRFYSDNTVVWVEAIKTQSRGLLSTDYHVTAYLQDNVKMEKARSAKTTDLTETVLEGGSAMLVRFEVTGEVFMTAEKREVADPHRLELYRTALDYARSIEAGPRFVVQAEALVPELPVERQPQQQVVTETGKPVEIVEKEKEPSIVERLFGPQEAPAPVEEPQPKFAYPVVFAPVGPEALKFDMMPGPDDTRVATLQERFYVSQKQDEEGRLLELQADSAVVFFTGKGKEVEEADQWEELATKADIRGIYLAGDVVMTEGQRTVRADEVFYDFQNKRAIAINAEMRNFDSERGIPVYVRAAKLRQLSANKFSAKNVTLTTSEFYVPQISATASSIIITDTTTVDEQLGRLGDASYDAEMRDVRFKMGRRTIFGLPFMRSSLQQPDLPLESAHIGYDNTWGVSIETRWYLARVLGLRESPGTKSRFLLDYFGDRGVGTGVEIEYNREDHFGLLRGYVIDDHGEDRLGRSGSRKDLEPPRDLRGRFAWVHRHFLPYDWQLTAGIDYTSDEHFVEQYYRDEFIMQDRETYLHLKRAQDNWAIAFLAKPRLNDFYEELEELPSGEFHLTGQSLFDDKFTLYSDTQAARLRQRVGNEHMIAISERDFAFVSHRTELDMPLWIKPFKVVPYVAGWFGYDDRSGFTRTLVDGTNMGRFGSSEVWIAEAGVRVGTQFWKVYPDVKSRMWDLNQIRHIIQPRLTAAIFEESDLEVRQKDVLSIGVSQRLQTKRGPKGNQRTVDWMRLDLEATWVNEADPVSDMGPGPDRFIWNKPIVPLRVLSAPSIFNGDLGAPSPTFEMYGPRRDYIGGDYIWRVSDTMAVLADGSYDTRSGVMQQFNFGLTRLVWPDLSFYVGTRYLRRVQVLNEKGSNAVTFAATYQLDPRYTLVFAQQFDFDYGANVRSEISLIRRYHRVYWGLTYSADQSLDRQAIMVSIWPQGVPELAVGHRQYAKISQPSIN